MRGRLRRDRRGPVPTVATSSADGVAASGCRALPAFDLPGEVPTAGRLRTFARGRFRVHKLRAVRGFAIIYAAMGDTATNRKRKSARSSESKASQVEPFALPGLKVGDGCADLWAFRYDESRGRLSHVLTCTGPHAWRFDEIGGRARDLVFEVCAANARAMPEKCDDKETAEWLLGAVYKRTLDVVNDLGDKWISPEDGNGRAVDADFVVDALSPYKIGLVSRFAREAVELPVVFVDEYMDGRYMGEPSGPRWLRLDDEDLQQAARPLPDRHADGFAARKEAFGPDAFADCVLGGYPLERAFDNMFAVIEWWGRALGCRAEAFGVESAARSVMRWLCFDAEFSDDGLRNLSRRVQRLDDVAQDMAVSVLRVQDRRAAENERADAVGADGGKKKRGKHAHDTAVTGVSVFNREILDFYNKHKIRDREPFADVWERCADCEMSVSGVKITLRDACNPEKFGNWCKGAGRTKRYQAAKKRRA